MVLNGIQYILDEDGNTTGVIVPIELWREINKEEDTAYLLKSEKMKNRLMAVMERSEGISYKTAREKLGI